MSGIKLALYYSDTCWFCARVQQTLKDLGMTIDLRDVGDHERREELMRGGGKTQVPCLRIETDSGAIRWLYESADISRYLIDHAK